jgi:hypothetical protein
MTPRLRTANNILAHEARFQLAFAPDIISVISSVALTALLYDLFRPVNRSLSLTAAFVHFVGLAIASVGSLLLLAPLMVLTGGQYLSVFNVEQSQALACVFLAMNAQAWNQVFMVFFAVYAILIGYLILRSIFLPRIMDALMALAGLGYLTLLYAPLADYLHPYNLVPGALGETSLILWLTIVGVGNCFCF